MSALYGRLTGDRAKTQATRQANESVHAGLETWDACVVLALEADGTFRVSAREKDAAPETAVHLGTGTITNEGVAWHPNRDAEDWTQWYGS